MNSTTLENLRLAEQAEKEIKDRRTQEKAERDVENKRQLEAWEAARPQREAEAKRARDLAAKAAESARKVKKSEIISGVRNDYPGISAARRAAINSAIFGDYRRNYILSGRGGIGKTTMLRALAALVETDGLKVVQTDGLLWENNLRRYLAADFNDKPETLTEYIRRQGHPVLVCLDEVDKISRTEFVLNHLHALIDAIKDGHHQLVITTNLGKSEFTTLFGDSLVWRLLQAPEANGRGGLGCAWVNFADNGVR